MAIPCRRIFRPNICVMRFARDSLSLSLPTFCFISLFFLHMRARVCVYAQSRRSNRAGMIFHRGFARRVAHRRHPINSAVRIDNGQICKQCCKANKLVRIHSRAFQEGIYRLCARIIPAVPLLLARAPGIHAYRRKSVPHAPFFPSPSLYARSRRACQLFLY